MSLEWIATHDEQIYGVTYGEGWVVDVSDWDWRQLHHAIVHGQIVATKPIAVEGLTNVDETAGRGDGNALVWDESASKWKPESFPRPVPQEGGAATWQAGFTGSTGGAGAAGGLAVITPVGGANPYVQLVDPHHVGNLVGGLFVVHWDLSIDTDATINSWVQMIVGEDERIFPFAGTGVGIGGSFVEYADSEVFGFTFGVLGASEEGPLHYTGSVQVQPAFTV